MIERFWHNGGRVTSLLWVALAVAVVWGALATWGPWGDDAPALEFNNPYDLVNNTPHFGTEIVGFTKICNNLDVPIVAVTSARWVALDIVDAKPAPSVRVTFEPGCIDFEQTIPLTYGPADSMEMLPVGAWKRVASVTILSPLGIAGGETESVPFDVVP